MIEAAQKQNIFSSFAQWHFKDALAGLFGCWKNFLVFNWQFFSIGELCRTLFSHWHKMADSYGRGFDPSTFFTILLGNLISRFLGTLVRLVFIVIGLLLEIFIFIIGAAIIILWIFLPLWIVLGLLAGIGLLI